MVDSARLGAVVDEGAAGAVELVVECDGGGEADEALQDAFAQAGECAGAVAFEREDVFAGPEDALDALADRRQVRPAAGLVTSAGPHDRGVQFADGCGERAAGVALVAEQDLAALAATAREQPERDVALVDLWRGECQGAWCAIGREDRVQPKPPEIAAVTSTPAVIGGVTELGATNRFAALCDGTGVLSTSSRSSVAPGLWLANMPSNHSSVSASRRRRLK